MLPLVVQLALGDNGLNLMLALHDHFPNNLSSLLRKMSRLDVLPLHALHPCHRHLRTDDAHLVHHTPLLPDGLVEGRRSHRGLATFEHFRKRHSPQVTDPRGHHVLLDALRVARRVVLRHVRLVALAVEAGQRVRQLRRTQEVLQHVRRRARRRLVRRRLTRAARKLQLVGRRDEAVGGVGGGGHLVVAPDLLARDAKEVVHQRVQLRKRALERLVRHAEHATRRGVRHEAQGGVEAGARREPRHLREHRVPHRHGHAAAQLHRRRPRRRVVPARGRQQVQVERLVERAADAAVLRQRRQPQVRHAAAPQRVERGVQQPALLRVVCGTGGAARPAHHRAPQRAVRGRRLHQERHAAAPRHTLRRHVCEDLPRQAQHVVVVSRDGRLHLRVVRSSSSSSSRGLPLLRLPQHERRRRLLRRSRRRAAPEQTGAEGSRRLVGLEQREVDSRLLRLRGGSRGGGGRCAALLQLNARLRRDAVVELGRRRRAGDGRRGEDVGGAAGRRLAGRSGTPDLLLGEQRRGRVVARREDGVAQDVVGLRVEADHDVELPRRLLHALGLRLLDGRHLRAVQLLVAHRTLRVQLRLVVVGLGRHRCGGAEHVVGLGVEGGAQHRIVAHHVVRLGVEDAGGGGGGCRCRRRSSSVGNSVSHQVVGLRVKGGRRSRSSRRRSLHLLRSRLLLSSLRFLGRRLVSVVVDRDVEGTLEVVQIGDSPNGRKPGSDAADGVEGQGRLRLLRRGDAEAEGGEDLRAGVLGRHAEGGDVRGDDPRHLGVDVAQLQLLQLLELSLVLDEAVEGARRIAAQDRRSALLRCEQQLRPPRQHGDPLCPPSWTLGGRSPYTRADPSLRRPP
eukprot:Rhum_TRINITY_DN12460_c1_g1::Rhum_TRINITY_DN12460_c1_g1_i1::g.51617::m.51617